jgi:DNA repair protein RecN (Recombination protein N)
MLLRLKISNYLLIEQLELDFLSGLTVVTGETGSGKSIIIDALMLLFGARIPKDIIRHPEKQLIFEAEFKLSNPTTINWLSNNDLADTDSVDNLICRRIIDNQGKNKAYINGNAVTNSQIKALGELILDIHIQHASITLLKSDTQRSLLDEYAGIQTKAISNVFKAWNEARYKLDQALNKTQELEEDKQRLELAIAELTEINLKPGEWEEINQEQKQLANAGEVLQELDFAQNILQGQDHAVIKKISLLNSRLQKIIPYVPKVEELINLLSSAEIELEELSNSLEALATKVELDPDNLTKLEARINLIFDLSRKYKILPEQMSDKLEEWTVELNNLNHGYDITYLEAEVSRLSNEYNQLAKEISINRERFAKDLSRKVTDYLHRLAITGEFSIRLIPLTERASYGMENVEYYVSFNKGILQQPLAKAASGGELSRTALALYLLLSIHNPPEIIIFDEIDVGIGGKVASIVGEMLNQLGLVKQVICITHQPQTASFGDNHLVVQKHNNHAVTLAEISYANGDTRIKEIARMLGGVTITATTLSHAAEMLLNARVSGEK